MFRWMAWTAPVAVFFVAILVMLIGMTAWELRSPTTLRRGFLPIATTRGDRLFIGLLAVGFANLAFVAARPWIASTLGTATPPSMYVGFGLSLVLLMIVMRKG